MTNVGEVKQVKRSKARHNLEQQRQDEELREVLDTYSGRAVIWRILGSCALYQAAPGDKDQAYRQSGRRDVGLELIANLDKVNKTAYSIMANEAVSRDTTANTPDITTEKEEFHG